MNKLAKDIETLQSEIKELTDYLTYINIEI
jgi:hypothetical protein